jgi:hypothetical protein
MGTFKARYEDEAKKMAESERTVNSLEIQKKAIDKQSEIQRKQMLDKVNQLNLQITAEKDTREVWINRYEKEQKAHIQTHTESMAARGQIQELQLKLEND